LILITRTIIGNRTISDQYPLNTHPLCHGAKPCDVSGVKHMSSESVYKRHSER